MVACPSRSLDVLYRMLKIFACYVLTYVWDAVSIFNHLPRMFLVHGRCFSNNGLNKLPWTSYLHAILRIISRGVSGLATDSPCGVWAVNEPLASYMIRKWELVCKCGVRFHIFIIISCLGSRFYASNYWSFTLTFSYTKYFVIYSRRSLYSVLHMSHQMPSAKLWHMFLWLQAQSIPKIITHASHFVWYILLHCVVILLTFSRRMITWWLPQIH